MSVEIITIGNELLSGSTIDTNAPFIAARVIETGLSVSRMSSVSDAEEDIIAALKNILPETRYIIVTGGLGPTDDDRTAEAAARAFGRTIELNQEALAAIEQRFAGYAAKMPFPSQRQAMLPAGVKIIPNQRGTASGFLIADAGREFMFMPGVPAEAEAMTESFIIPRLKQKSGFRQVILSKSLRVFGLWESAVQERLDGRIQEGPGLSLAYLPQFPEVRLKITGRGEDAEAVRQEIARAAAVIEEKLGEYIYSVNDEPLELVTGQVLKEKRATVAIAESCTGGLISHRLTNISGSSDYLLMGVVVYSNRAKVELLKIPEKVLQEHGAVSEPCARLMAQNVRELAGATYGLAVTGIAGPAGGSAEKPVGTVFIGIASAAGGTTSRHRCYGNREQIKLMSSHLALNSLRTFIKNDGTI